MTQIDIISNKIKRKIYLFCTRYQLDNEVNLVKIKAKDELYVVTTVSCHNKITRCHFYAEYKIHSTCTKSRQLNSYSSDKLRNKLYFKPRQYTENMLWYEHIMIIYTRIKS